MSQKIKAFFLLLTIVLSSNVFAWGQNGHRIVGQLAQTHLSKKTQDKIKKIIGNETLAQVSTWPDFIKSDSKWKESIPWHYLSIPKDVTIDTAPRPTQGDILSAIDKFSHILSDKKSTQEEKSIALKFLVHLVGDIHQPMHVGRSEDEGGNKIIVKWFNQKTNLHKVWDDSLIDQEELSFSEYSVFINHPTKDEIITWQKSMPIDWYKESFELRNEIYAEIDKDTLKELNSNYLFKYNPIVHKQLLKAGIRLAGLLNKILM